MLFLGGQSREFRGVSFDCVLVLCFVMDYVLQFGEIEHKTVRYHHHHEVPITNGVCTVVSGWPGR